MKGGREMISSLLVRLCGYALFVACMGVFMMMLVRLEVGGWISRMITKYTKAIEMSFTVACFVAFFVVLWISHATIRDPQVATDVLNGWFAFLISIWRGSSGQ